MLKKFRRRFSSKIANKIFLSSLILIAFILFIQWFMFTFLFDDAYIYSKEYDLEASFDSFMEELKDKNYDIEYANLLTVDYIEETGNPIAILSGDENIENYAFIETYFDSMTLRKNEQIYKLALDSIELELLNYDSINALLVPIGNGWYYPEYLTDERITEAEIKELEEENIILIEHAEIIDFERSDVDSDYSGIFVFLGYEYIENGEFDPSKNRPQAFKVNQSEFNANLYILIDSYTIDDKTYYVLTSQVFSKIHDQIDFVKSFNMYSFFIGLILAILLTRFYSKSISKPMVELKEIANEMSSLEFKNKIKVKTHDEIGSLGESLNELSNQLEKSISDLESTNHELRHNYDQKSKEEQRAKDLILHLSHELNTPLGIVSGFNEVLSDGINDKEPQYYYDAMANEIERMKILINDMLELSVLESHNYQLEMTTIHLNRIVNDVMKNYGHDFEDKNVKITIDLHDQTALGNAKKLYQVINNFIGNASKYTDENGTFKIVSEVKEDTLTYKFTNTCTSLIEKDLSKLWGKFYRTSATNTRKEKGSGIGLSIAKEILEHHKSLYGITLKDNELTIAFTLKKT